MVAVPQGSGLKWGAVIRVTGKGGPGGHHNWIVRDHLGSGAASNQLDFWVSSCGIANAWGRRLVRVRVMP